MSASTKLADYFGGKFLKADDLDGPVTVTIETVEPETFKDESGKETTKLVARFEEMTKGLILNATNARFLGEITGGKTTEDLIGSRICLYVDPNVYFAGRKIPAIRITDVS